MKHIYFTLTALLLFSTLTYSQGVFKQFTAENTGSNQLLEPYIIDIAEYNDSIWVLTGNGFNIYHKSNYGERVINFWGTQMHCPGSLETDNDGFLWYASCNGLYKYDGTWTNYNTSNSALPYNSLQNLKFDHNNNIWIRSDNNGIIKFDPTGNTSTTFNTSNGLADNEVKDFAIDTSSNLIWITYGCNNNGCEHGLTKMGLDGSNPFTYTQTNTPSMPNIQWEVVYSEGNGTIWLGAGNTITSFDGTTWTDHNEILGAGQSYHIGFFIYHENGITYTNNDVDPYGIIKYDGTTGTIFGTGDGAVSNYGRCFLKASDGNFWIGTIEGLSVWNGASSWTNITTKDGYPGIFTPVVYTDNNNTLWYGSGQITGYKNNDTYTNYGPSDIPYHPGCQYNDMIQDNAGNYWFAGECIDGVIKFDGTTWSHLNDASYGNLSGGTSYELFEDNAGNIWIGSDKGVTKYNPNADAWTAYSSGTSGLINDWVYGITQDNGGNIWFATEGGISKFDGTSTFTTYSTSNVTQITNNDFISAFKQSDGTLWFGNRNSGGVTKFDGSTWTNYNSNNTNIGCDHIAYMHEDSKGNLWFATCVGVTRFDGTTWKVFTEDDGFGNIGVHEITERNDTLWFGTDKGLWSYFEPEPFTEVAFSLIDVDGATLDWGDFDADGDMDIVATGFDGLSSSQIAKVFQNTNGSFSSYKDLETIDGGEAKFVDTDGDGDLDVVTSGSYLKTYNYSTTGYGAANTSIQNIGLMDWGDFDNDGDLDMVSASTNVGIFETNHDNSLSLLTNLGLGSNLADAKWIDYDNDNDFDVLYVGKEGTYLLLAQNNGNNTFSDATPTNWIGYTSGAIDIGDYNADGNMDFAVSGYKDNGATLFLEIYRNDGAGSFTSISGDFEGVQLGNLKWFDADNDGDLDLLVNGDLGNSVASNYNSSITLYRNEGNDSFVKTPLNMVSTSSSDMAIADYDNDGDIDYLIAGVKKPSGYYTSIGQNNSLTPNTKPNAPSGLNQTQNDTIMNLFWTSNGDDKTPKVGLSYNVRIGTTSGGRDIVSPHALDDGTLTKAEIGNAQLGTSFKIVGLPAGTYYWSVQAIDHGFKGSDWSAEATFTVNSPDLSVSDFSVDPITVVQGGQINVSYVINNLSTQAAAAHSVKCFISSDAVYDAGVDTLLDTYNITSLPGNTSSALITRQVTIPNDFSLGSKIIIVMVDPENIIPETDENNNIISTTCEVTEPAIIEGGLIAYYPFNGNLNDESGNNKTATAYNNITYSNDRYGQANAALQYDALTSYMTTPISNTDLGNTYTISCWVNLTLKNQYSIFVMYNNDTDNDIKIQLIYENGISFHLNNGNDGIMRTSPNHSFNQWEHITVTYNNGTWKYYINGTLSDTFDKTIFNVNSSKIFWGTHEPINSDYTFDGSLDEIGIYNKVLTDAEVQALYLQGVHIGEPKMFARQANNPVALDTDISIVAAWTDINNDNFPDIYVGRDQVNSLLHKNNGLGSFDEVLVDNLSSGTTYPFVKWADMDNDGFVDGISQNGHIYYNNGDDTFTETASFTNTGYVSVVDIENDGDLDIFVVRSENNALYLNNGDKTFTEVTTGDIVNTSNSTYAAYWVDLNNDRYQDLFVANAGVSSELYFNNGDGTFRQSSTSGITASVDGNNESVSFGDVNNDTFIDVMLGNGGELYINNGNETFTLQAEYGASSSMALGDYNNDGFLDFFKGPVNSCFIHLNNGNGTFTQIPEDSSGIVQNEMDPRGVGLADYNRDGALDIFVATIGAGITSDGMQNLLYLNNGNANNWSQIKLNGIMSNKSAIGARIYLTATINGSQTRQTREISVTSNGHAQNELIQHFGLGDATTIDKIEVLWPSTQVTILENQNINELLTINEPTSQALSFDGVGDVIEISNNVSNMGISNELTVEAWFNMKSYPESSVGAGIIDIGCGNLRLMVNPLGYIFYHTVEDGGGSDPAYTADGIQLKLNEWYHIGLTRTASYDIAFYINGELINTFENTVKPQADYSFIFIGVDCTQPDRYFNGLIDEVRIWNNVRTEQQIKDNLNNYLKGNEPGLVAYYQFNEGSGQTIYDRTANGYNGTLGADALAGSDDPIWTATNWPYFEPKPDLTVIEQSIDNTLLTANAVTNAQCKIRNIGDGNAVASVMRIYLSDNETYETGSDTQLASSNVAAINAGDTSVLISSDITIPAGTAEGNYFIIFVSDINNTIDESNEDNNVVSIAIQVEKEIIIPVAPSDLSVSTLSSSELSLSWTDNSDNEDGFEISRSLNQSTDFEVIDSVTADVTSFTDGGLLTNTEYFYTVRAYNIKGYSDDSNTASGTTDNTAPNAPTDVFAEAGSKTRIDLSWTDIADNEDGFKVYRSATSGGTVTLVETLTPNIEKYSDEGLEPETTYYYKVCAFNNIDEACTNEISVTTLSNLTPDVTNAECCFGDEVPDLTAVGENIKWYSDSNLSNIVSTDNSFATGITQPGEHKFYVTQTKNETESDPAVAILYIYELPEVSAGNDFEGCSSGVVLDASNPTGVGQWSIVEGNGNIADDYNPSSSFSSTDSDPITLRYTVTDANQCVNFDEVKITLKESPETPNIHLKGGFIFICTDAEMAGYQWYHDDLIINGATQQFYAAPKPVSGVYSVEITNEQGCTNKAAYSSKSANLTLDETVNLYPNPFNEIVNLIISNEYTGDIRVNIYDFNGREVAHANFEKAAFSYNTKLNTQHLKPGFYMVSFTFPDNKTVHKQIIKN